MKNYQLVKTTLSGYGKEIENFKGPSSVDYWLKMAKKDEKVGSNVTITFEYDSKNKKTVMKKYSAVNFKNNEITNIYIKK